MVETGTQGASAGVSALTEQFRQFTRHPFQRLPVDWVASDEAREGALLNTSSAKQWFGLIDAVRQASLCTYQVPLDRASSATSSAFDTPLVLFSSYSYLGLNDHPRINAAAEEAVRRFGTTTGGVRMLTGTLTLHLELEEALAAFVGQPGAATFASGYDANVAAVHALFGPADLVVIDRYAHRSLYDAVRMAGCEVRRFGHSDLEELESILRSARTDPQRRILVVVDAVYSMDGDEAPLRELVDLKDRFGAFLLVDESHSIGATGPTGRGLWEAHGVEPERVDIVTGSLAKAIPSGGGFVAGSMALKVFMQFGSSPYFFSAALTPPNAAAILESLRVIQDEPVHLERLRANTQVLREGLAAQGLNLGTSVTHVIPVRLGDEFRAFTWARTLLDHGIAVSAVPYPAVPIGQARLRLCATSAHRPEHYTALLESIAICQGAESSDTA